MRFILASASPRRKELLEAVGMKFEIIKSVSEENPSAVLPQEVVLQLSQQKAKEVAEGIPMEEPFVVIGADTIVCYENEIMGKPVNREDAYRMIHLLQGKKHNVFTGVTIAVNDRNEVRYTSFFSVTEVFVYPMTDSMIEQYLDTNEYTDKAGAYAIQGKFMAYIEKINGDYANVVGLPVARLLKELREEHISIL